MKPTYGYYIETKRWLRISMAKKGTTVSIQWQDRCFFSILMELGP